MKSRDTPFFSKGHSQPIRPKITLEKDQNTLQMIEHFKRKIQKYMEFFPYVKHNMTYWKLCAVICIDTILHIVI